MGSITLVYFPLGLYRDFPFCWIVFPHLFTVQLIVAHFFSFFCISPFHSYFPGNFLHILAKLIWFQHNPDILGISTVEENFWILWTSNLISNVCSLSSLPLSSFPSPSLPPFHTFCCFFLSFCVSYLPSDWNICKLVGILNIAPKWWVSHPRYATY